MTHESAIDEHTADPIAVVGIGCSFPGGADSPQAYWDLLCRGVDATRELPEDRWETSKFYDPDGTKLGKMSTFRGGFLERIDQFDAQFFGISPREAIWLDPQQRLLLRTAWEAFEDGGHVVGELAGTDVGVFMAGFTLDYQLLQNYGVYSRYELQPHSATGMMMTMLANRLSHSFDFRGPSMSVDTACSGSLVAVHLAAQSIRNGECSMALAGGANVMIAPNMTIAESKGGFLASDGRSKAFSASADGYGRGEGAGVVVLKPLEQAQRDGDPIYALILGSAVSQDGRTDGITVPSTDAQEAAMRAAYQRAGIAPGDVQYIEAHGTGTPVGDPIEAATIGRVLTSGRREGDTVRIGSVKTNIGHLEAAAGVAGLIKTALALRNGQIPAQLTFGRPNPEIDFEGLGLTMQTELGDWPEVDGPRYAAINSFGFGGTNAHVVMQGGHAPAGPAISGAAQRSRREASTDSTRRYLVPLSARHPDALLTAAGDLADYVDGVGADASLPDVGYTRSQRRDHHQHRLGVVAATSAELSERLRAVAAGRPEANAVLGRVAPASASRYADSPKVAFVCSGMGPQWWGMARSLLTGGSGEPGADLFRGAVEVCDEKFRQLAGWSLLDELLADESHSRMAEADVAQPANFAIQVGLAEMWRSWGIEPHAVVGHSAGEVAAQYFSGVLSFDDAVRVIYHRSRLQQRTTGDGRMLAVGMTPETLTKAVADAGPTVSVAAINSPRSVTLSGEAEVLDGMARQLETFDVFHRFLPVKVPYHSHYMDRVRSELEESLVRLRPRTAALPLYSTVTGSRIDGAGADANYWWQNVRATVLFAAAVRQMIADGYTHFVELSPHPVLATPLTELLAEASDESDQADHDLNGLVVPSLRRDEADDVVLLRSLATLYTRGHNINWEKFYQGPDANLVRLPTYPWQLSSYWNESAEAVEDRHYQQVHPLLGQRLNEVHPTWEREIGTRLLPYLADHRVQGRTMLPGAAHVELAAAAANQVYGSGGYTLLDLDLRKALVLDEVSDPRVRTTVHAEQGRVEVAAYTALPGGAREWNLLASAQLSQMGGADKALNLAAARAECTTRMSRAEISKVCARMGFDYGPAFSGLETLLAGNRRAVGQITAPREISEDATHYHAHPALVDAAFQALLIAAATNGESGPDETSADGGAPGADAAFLPVGIDSVDIAAADVPLPDELTVIAEVTHIDADTLTGDIAVCAGSGAVRVNIRGFTARSVEYAARLTPAYVDKSIHEIEWREQPMANDVEPADLPDGPWLVFADDGGVGDALAAELADAGRRVVIVRHSGGESPEQAAAGQTTIIDPADEDQYSEIVAAAQPGTIVHLWSLDAAPGGNDDLGDDALSRAADLGALSLLHTVQALAAEEVDHQLWLATRYAQPAGGDAAGLAISQAPTWGLARVIGHQEFTGAWGGVVDLDDSPASAQAQQLLAEIAARHSTSTTATNGAADAGSDDDQVAYRSGRRLVPRLVETSRLTRAMPATLRRDGSYLVTGGLGALGFVVADFLADRGARRLVLTGRSELPPRDAWATLPADHPRHDAVSRIRKLEEQGVSVEYAAIDIADEDRLREWLSARAQSGRSAIRGVVHSAGVVDDRLLARMSREAFEQVLRPKVHGGWALHRAFPDADLDFFVLFSSTGSVIASPGQGNYAAANAFLDALAHYRRGCGLPATTIGWGPWSVGMVDELNLADTYARRGIDLISPEIGVAVLERMLGQQPPHVVAVTADWAVARESSIGGRLPAMFRDLGDTGDDIAAGSGTGEASILAEIRNIPAAERAGALATHVRGIIAAVLGLDQGDIGDDDALSGLGVDSMMAIEMKHRLDRAVGSDVPVLDMVQAATVTALAERVLQLVDVSGSADEPDDADEAVASETSSEADDELRELEAMLAEASDEDLQRLLAELDADDAR